MEKFKIDPNTEITPDLLEEIINFNEEERERLTELHDYYRGIHAILNRKDKASAVRSNNKIVTNHARYITDINVGYLLGNPIEYQAEDKINIDPIIEEYRKQTISDLDHELDTKRSQFGKIFEYVYYNEDNELKSKVLDPRNCVMVYDDTIQNNEMFAVVYTLDMSKKEDDKTRFKRVTVIDDTTISEYVKDGEIQKEPVEETDHFLEVVPVIQYLNNSEAMGDYEDVISIINAYNLLQSDRVNDKEQAVDAILALYGFGLTDDQKEELKQKRTLGNIPKDAKAEYIVRTLNESEVEVLKRALQYDIHKISKTPDLSDEKFVGNSSGVAIKYKLLAFEQNTKNRERYLEKGLMKRFRIYNTYLAKLKKMQKVETYKVDAVFKRNLPQNDFETSQMMLNLADFVDRETLVGQLSFIKDASEIIKAKLKEREEMMNEEEPLYGSKDTTKTKQEDKETNQDE